MDFEQSSLRRCSMELCLMRRFEYAALITIGLLGAAGCGSSSSSGPSSSGDDTGDDAQANPGSDAGADGAQGSGPDASTEGLGADAGDATTGATGTDAASDAAGATGTDATTGATGTDAASDAAGATGTDAAIDGGSDGGVAPDAGGQGAADASADGGTDGGSCAAHYVATSHGCTPPATRPIGPMTGNAVSTRTPTLTWALPTGFTAARVDVCTDAKCSNVAWSAVVTGTSTVVGSTLPTGMIDWRLTTIDVDGVTPGTLVSAVWEFAVSGTHSAPQMTSWPSFADIEGDGFADFITDDGAGGAAGTHIYELPGSASGIVNVDQSSWGAAVGGCGGLSLYPGGDINGDGYSDLVAQDCGGIEVLLGSPTGFPTTPSYTTPYMPGGSAWGVTGDFNGDGYADLATADGTTLAEINGSPTGFPNAVPATVALPSGADLATVRLAGDVNGDGYADVVVNDGTFGGGVGRIWVYLGSSTGLGVTPGYTILAPGGITNFGYTEFFAFHRRNRHIRRERRRMARPSRAGDRGRGREHVQDLRVPRLRDRVPCRADDPDRRIGAALRNDGRRRRGR